MIKRFIVFAYTTYEASGGWDDLIGLFETLEEARKSFPQEMSHDRAQIVDLEKGEVVFYWGDALEWTPA